MKTLSFTILFFLQYIIVSAFDEPTNSTSKYKPVLNGWSYNGNRQFLRIDCDKCAQECNAFFLDDFCDRCVSYCR